VVSPIRDPWDVYVTWYSRDRDIAEMFDEWYWFDDAYRRQIPLIVPVDTADRETHLDTLSKRLKYSFTTDWSPVESMARKIPPKIDLSGIYELPVVKRFYGDRHG